MNGFTVNANVEIDNTNHITLTGAARTTGLLTFTNGKIILGANNFIMAPTATFAGAATGKFVETNGTGQLRREIAANGNLVLPLGTGTRYTPLEYQVAGAAFAAAYVSGRSVNGGHPNKHPRSSDFLNQYWSLTTSGITGGTVTTVGSYTDATDLTGVESDIRAVTWNGANWALGTTQNNAANTVTAAVTGTSGDLYAMNRFLLASPTVYLQAAFNVSTPTLMNDRIRNSGAYTPGVYPASNLIPLTDPYRSAPYSTTYSHVNNTVPETILQSVLNDQAVAANNIVDWVYIELRTIVSPTQATVTQTRSVLLRRNGTLVDVDGVSPVYFKNVDPGNYVLSIRHRNHLGISISPAAPTPLSFNPSGFNFGSAGPASLFGTANTNYRVMSGINVMWAGNANHNPNVRYTGIDNDKDVVQADFVLVGLPVNYYRSDLNLNRTVRYTGIDNDKDFLLSNIINIAPVGQKLQTLPN